MEGFTSPSKFHDLLRDDSKHIHSIRIVNEELLEVVHNHPDECVPNQVNINIFIACFTTCWACLKLYEGIKQLHPEQVLYFDSLIYHWKPGQPELPLGNYLGEFTNELELGDYIVEFAAAGCKNYAYNTHMGKTECKVRGFSFNSRGQQQLNFDILKKTCKTNFNTLKWNRVTSPCGTLSKSQEITETKNFAPKQNSNVINWSSTNAWSIPSRSNLTPMDFKNMNSTITLMMTFSAV